MLVRLVLAMNGCENYCPKGQRTRDGAVSGTRGAAATQRQLVEIVHEIRRGEAGAATAVPRVSCELGAR